MRLRVASRQSELAKIQAYTVGRALQKHFPELEIEYFFRESLGDKNQSDPLWKMPEKGVFTEDFVDGLKAGEFDCVVHSWKDLPTAPRDGLEIAATLEREDPRDVILFHPRVAKSPQAMRILSSSPRRAYNLQSFLPEALPFPVKSLEFFPVRGNVQTRARKLFTEDADALVVAKAALDRLLHNPFEPTSAVRETLREQIRECLWMVMPVSENPPAAAQGALAIEIASHREDLKALFSKLNSVNDFSDVQQERQILSGYGGGCHQKIGVHVKTHGFGRVLVLRGLTDQGEVLRRREIVSGDDNEGAKVPAELLWPQGAKDTCFTRVETTCDLEEIKKAPGLFVAKYSAWPKDLQRQPGQLVWTAGVESWKRLAKLGVWVNGCQESVGGAPSPSLFTLLGGQSLSWLTLTHEAAAEDASHVGTYRLVPKSVPSSVLERRYFFWKSASTFQEMVRQYPQIRERHHACGPGKTLSQLQKLLPPENPPSIFLDEESWRKKLSKK